MRHVRNGAVVALAAVLVVGGCTSDSPEPTSSGSASSPAGDEHDYTVEGFAEEVLADDTLGELEDVGAVSGAVGDGQVEVQVVEVLADADGAELVMVLRGDASGEMHTWSDSRGVYPDIRAVDVVDTSSGWRLQPYTILDADGKVPVDCACAEFPQRLTDDGEVVHALLPPLTAGTTSVTVEIPGLEPVADVPVTWAR